VWAWGAGAASLTTTADVVSAVAGVDATTELVVPAVSGVSAGVPSGVVGSLFCSIGFS
jgi:hypothetical protein